MWRVWFLGLVQGLTEFLPISSSGHLIVVKYWFALPAPGASLEVALHLGTLMAIVVGYRQELWQWTHDLFQGSYPARQLLYHVFLATLPAAALGYFFEDRVVAYFIPSAVIVGWAVTSLLLWLTPVPTSDPYRSIESLAPWEVLAIGTMQSLALWPGLSRSGSTIFMGRLFRLSPETCAQFSFYLAIPVLSGAFVLTWWRHPLQHPFSTPFALSGTIVAAISGLFAIKWVKSALKRPRVWRRFGLYTFGMAILTWWLGG